MQKGEDKMNVKDNVIKIIKGITGVKEIKDTDRLLVDLGLDSLRLIALLIECESKFKIEFKESDMNIYDLITVRDVIALAEKYIGGA